MSNCGSIFMKMLCFVMIVTTSAIVVLNGCHKGSRCRFDHATKWYEYSFKRGPGIAGFTYEFDRDVVVARMFGASLQDGALHEYDGYRMSIVRRTPDGYEVVSESGVCGRLRFDGDDLLLEWENRNTNAPERKLTSVPPDFEKLRDQWEVDTGVSVEDFLKDE